MHLMLRHFMSLHILPAIRPIEPSAGRVLRTDSTHMRLVAKYAPALWGRACSRATSAIDNHKAYVQCWIQAIREKPETLIKAINDAQMAANYMDWKAGLITDMEYQKAVSSVLEIKQKPREHER